MADAQSKWLHKFVSVKQRSHGVDLLLFGWVTMDNTNKTRGLRINWVEVKDSTERKTWTRPGTLQLVDFAEHKQAFEDAQGLGKVYRLEVGCEESDEASSSDESAPAPLAVGDRVLMDGRSAVIKALPEGKHFTWYKLRLDGEEVDRNARRGQFLRMGEQPPPPPPAPAAPRRSWMVSSADLPRTVDGKGQIGYRDQPAGRPAVKAAELQLRWFARRKAGKRAEASSGSPTTSSRPGRTCATTTSSSPSFSTRSYCRSSSTASCASKYFLVGLRNNTLLVPYRPLASWARGRDLITLVGDLDSSGKSYGAQRSSFEPVERLDAAARPSCSQNPSAEHHLGEHDKHVAAPRPRREPGRRPRPAEELRQDEGPRHPDPGQERK